MALFATSPNHLPQRLIALGVSVVVALAAGTPYLYGVFSPQLVQRVGLTTSDSATISLATNVGAGLGGLPAGLVIDHYGPQLSILLGSTCIFLGYFSLYKIYVNIVSNLPIICISMTLVGFGSITSFFATLKAAQSNFPHHRGSAGALPVSAFGLSATIFSLIAVAFFGTDTAGLLLFLSLFCGSVTFSGSFFVHVYLEHNDSNDPESYTAVAQDGEESALISRSNSSTSLVDEPVSRNLHKSRSFADSLRGSFSFWGIGERTPPSSTTSSLSEVSIEPQEQTIPLSTRPDLQRGASAARLPAPKPVIISSRKERVTPLVTIKKRLSDKTFLTHFFVVGLSSGICQMYIYSVGFVVTAQYNYDKTHENNLIRALTYIRGGAPNSGAAAALQAVQVSVISLASFSGRLSAGLLSDYIHKRFHKSRLWIVLFTSIILGAGQLITIKNVNNPHLITLASAIIGGCYGLSFGTYPAVIADQFGTRTFSTTWGLICVAPTIVLFTLNKYFGHIYDSNSDNETGICYKGNGCYKGAFEVSFGLCFIVFFTILTLIAVQRRK